MGRLKDDAEYSRLGASQFVDQYLTTGGDGSGSEEQTVDGSVTPVEFYITPPAGQVYLIKFMSWDMICSSSIDSLLTYGNIAPLTNGVIFAVEEVAAAVTIRGLNGTRPIRDNADLFFMGMQGTDIGNRNDANALTGYTDFMQVFGSPLRLTEEERLVCRVQDDLTSIVSQKMLVTGRIISPNT